MCPVGSCPQVGLGLAPVAGLVVVAACPVSDQPGFKGSLQHCLVGGSVDVR